MPERGLYTIGKRGISSFCEQIVVNDQELHIIP
jgi:hypothetical protein